MELKDYSIEDLEEALELKKEQKLRIEKPVPLKDIDYERIKVACCDYISEIEDLGYGDDDFPQYLYELTIKVVFGKKAFNWINKFF